jgi:uncharacterized protein
MGDIWRAAEAGDSEEVERLVGQDPGLLDALDFPGMTPLMYASEQGHVGVVRLLLDKGAAVNKQSLHDGAALTYASYRDHTPVVRLLLERGADPSIAAAAGTLPLACACIHGHLEIVRSLLAHPSAKALINHRDDDGQTALWRTCEFGESGVARALLESGADPRSPTTAASPPWPSPSRILRLPTPNIRNSMSLPRAAGSAWRHWR